MEQKRSKQLKTAQPAVAPIVQPINIWKELKENIESLLQGNNAVHSDAVIHEMLKSRGTPSFETVSAWLRSGPSAENTKEGIKWKAKAQAYCERLKVLDLRANLGTSLVNRALQRSFHPTASLNGMNDWGKMEKALHLEIFEAEMRASRDPDEHVEEGSGCASRSSHAQDGGHLKDSTTPSTHSNYRESLIGDGGSQPTHRELPPIEELLTEVDPCTTEKKRNPHMDVLLPSMGWQDEEEEQPNVRSSKKFTQSFSATHILQYPNPREKSSNMQELHQVGMPSQFALNSSIYMAQQHHQTYASGHEMQKIERALFRSDSDRGIDTDREFRASLAKGGPLSKRESIRNSYTVRDLATLLQQKVQSQFFVNQQHQDILSRLLDNFMQVLDLAEGEKEQSPEKSKSILNTNQKLGSNHKVLKASTPFAETGKFATSTCTRKLSREKIGGGNDSFTILTRNLPGIEKILGCSPKWKGLGYPVVESPSKTKPITSSQLSASKRNPLQPVCTNSYIDADQSKGADHLNSLSPSRMKELHHSIYGTGDVCKDLSSDCLDLSVLKNHNFSVDLISAFQ